MLRRLGIGAALVTLALALSGCKIPFGQSNEAPDAVIGTETAVDVGEFVDAGGCRLIRRRRR